MNFVTKLFEGSVLEEFILLSSCWSMLGSFACLEHFCQIFTMKKFVPILYESDCTGAKFYYIMPFISSSELCSRI